MFSIFIFKIYSKSIFIYNYYLISFFNKYTKYLKELNILA